MKAFLKKIYRTLIEFVLKKYLTMQSKPSIVKHALAKEYVDLDLIKEIPLITKSSSKIKAASIQMELKPITKNHAANYVKTIFRLTKKAVTQGAHLVVFPEYSGIPLLGLMPNIEYFINKGIFKAPDIFYLSSSAIKEIYETTFSILSKYFRIYMVAGGTPLKDDDGKMRNISYLFDPHGNIVAKQRKLHLTGLETKLGFEQGEKLKIQDTMLGRIAFPTFLDISHFEIFRIAMLNKTDIVAIPSANIETFMPSQNIDTVWQRVQENQTFAILSCAVGNFMGTSFTGRSALISPFELTQSGDGYLAKANTLTEEEIIVGEFNLDALHDFREKNPPNFNLGLYRKYFSKTL